MLNKLLNRYQQNRSHNGIKVPRTVQRLYSRILRRLMEEECNSQEFGEQSAFRAGKSFNDRMKHMTGSFHNYKLNKG